MTVELIPESELTAKDFAVRAKFNRKRNLYNRYTPKQLADWKNVNLYEALNLDCFCFKEIPQENLQYALKIKSVEYHPMNNRGKIEAFILIKKAVSILSNKMYKAAYDSYLFDESIPEEREYTLEEFLDVFTPVFDRNGVFSETQPVPSLRGSVDVFYKFWNSFRTVRLYDRLEDVVDQRNSNRKYYAELHRDAIQKRKTADLLRIRELVTRAYRLDPRITRASRTVREPWKEEEVKSMRKFATLLGRSKNKYLEIAKKLNMIYSTNRTPDEIKSKLEVVKRM